MVDKLGDDEERVKKNRQCWAEYGDLCRCKGWKNGKRLFCRMDEVER